MSIVDIPPFQGSHTIGMFRVPGRYPGLWYYALSGLTLYPLFTNAPPYERVIGDLSGAISRRIDIQHRLVYQVLEEERVVKIIRMWPHYD